MGKRIIIIRHGEEPNNKKIKDIQTKIGLNKQGIIRTSLMPELTNKLFGDNLFELHTYTHLVKNKPTSRSFYTSQLIGDHSVLYKKSDNIKKLVKNVLTSKYKNIIICWEHLQIKKIIKKLIDKKINYDKISKKIFNRLGEKYKLLSVEQINIKNLDKSIKYCSDDYLKYNIKYRNNMIGKKQDIEYSLIWDIDLDNKKCSVYPNYIIKNLNNNIYNVNKYI